MTQLEPPPSHGTHLVLLGTSAGPIPTNRFQTSTALVVDGATYIIDAGHGLTHQFWRANLAFPAVRAIFVTHLHSDHVSDLFGFLSSNWTNWDFENQVIAIHGPGRANGAGPAHSTARGLPDAAAELITPSLPTPGIADHLRLSIEANAYDLNERIRSTRRRGDRPIDMTGVNGRGMFEPYEIAVPAPADVVNNCPPIDPLPVYEDDRVRVTATLVDHPPVFPAFAFRFDTAHGSVVVSGDTSPCDNLVALAHGVDVLVNEVQEIDASMQRFVGTPIEETMAHQFLTAHTPSRDIAANGSRPAKIGVGTLATRARAGHLVLHHLYPSDGSVGEHVFREHAAAHFDGPVTVGRDLLHVPVTRPV